MNSQTRKRVVLFERQVDMWVESQLAAGAGDFGDLVAGLPGVYPTVALDSVNRLADQGRIAPKTAQSLQDQARVGPIKAPSPRSLLPLPHPVNYEWRFTSDGARLLLNLAEDLSQPGDTVLLFGTPSVALEALSRPIDRPMALLSEDNAVTRRLAALNRATGSPLLIRFCDAGAPSHSAAIVILDPPWYLDFIRPMLAVAATACKLGGYVLISLPPEGARSTAADDRVKILGFAARLGLEVIAEQVSSLSYETPFFESNALAAAGVWASHTWRRGDLIALRKFREHDHCASTTSTRKERWCEVEIGRMRLLVRRDHSQEIGRDALISVVNGDVLPSVSRRDPRRRLAQVWTSGNRLFASERPEMVIEAALALSGKQSGFGAQLALCGTTAERDEVERVCYQLRDLAALEAREESRSRAAEVDHWRETWTSRSTNSWNALPIIASG